MSDCFPDVREGLPTSGRECSTMGTAFLSPQHTAGGGCCTHKQDGPVPVEAEDLFGQFSESQNIYQHLFCVRKCVLMKKGRSLNKLKGKKEWKMKEMEVAEAFPKQQILVLRDAIQPSQDGFCGFTDGPLLLSSEPSLVTPRGSTVRLCLSLKHLVQPLGEISEKFIFGAVLL